MLKQVLVLLLLVTSIAAETAYFEFVSPGRRYKPFIVQLNDDEHIQHARALVSGATKERPTIHGVLKMEKASYNPNYGFYINPITVFFSEPDETYCFCDFTPGFIQKNYDDACTREFLYQCTFCSSRMTLNREVSAYYADNHQTSFSAGGGFLDQEYAK